MERRRKQLQCGSPYYLSIEHKIKTDKPIEIEGFLQDKYANKKVEGAGDEWYALTPEDVEWLKHFQSE